MPKTAVAAPDPNEEGRLGRDKWMESYPSPYGSGRDADSPFHKGSGYNSSKSLMLRHSPSGNPREMAGKEAPYLLHGDSKNYRSSRGTSDNLQAQLWDENTGR